ncbi:hypothetical protein R3P38DRAFT_2837940 [Favolaschia claudopus]|uniref:Uncharacterized protein n=1 Tax=Favolaschia claudopus TaxID=2862362 RepID=A0AAW0E7H9_9AGAR
MHQVYTVPYSHPIHLYPSDDATDASYEVDVGGLYHPERKTHFDDDYIEPDTDEGDLCAYENPADYADNPDTYPYDAFRGSTPPYLPSPESDDAHRDASPPISIPTNDDEDPSNQFASMFSYPAVPRPREYFGDSMLAHYASALEGFDKAGLHEDDANDGDNSESNLCSDFNALFDLNYNSHSNTHYFDFNKWDSSDSESESDDEHAVKRRCKVHDGDDSDEEEFDHAVRCRCKFVDGEEDDEYEYDSGSDRTWEGEDEEEDGEVDPGCAYGGGEIPWRYSFESKLAAANGSAYVEDMES